MVFGAGIPRAVRTTWSESVRSIVRAIFTRNSWQGRKKKKEKGDDERGGGTNVGLRDRKGTKAMIFLLHFALLGSHYTRRPAIYPFRDSRL